MDDEPPFPPEEGVGRSGGGGGGGGGGISRGYNLWSSVHSLKRMSKKRRFDRSICGILLGASIVLVILGILGIIGIAVYLGGKAGGCSALVKLTPALYMYLYSDLL